MKLPLTIISAVIFVLAASAQDAMPDAAIEKYDMYFDMSSAESGTCNVTIRTHVMRQGGSKSGNFVLYTDSFRELSSFSGEISSRGKVIKKLKMQDLTKVLASSGLADDTFLHTYILTVAAPYTVEYSYKVTFRRGISSFPTFFPVFRPNVTLVSGSYVISVPAGTAINYSSRLTPERGTAGKKEIWSWQTENYKGYAEESLMPDIRELVPYVYACPVMFSLGGAKGCQSNWDELGAWLYGLQKDTKEIPETLRATLREMTADARSDYEKIKIIYDYLRKTTRYVSIQLGIGGLKPSPASEVLKSGFGDCKALANYMQAMLEAVGIKSEYLIVDTEDRHLLPGYASLGQMNHAMLCVPMEKDSLWIECTNPSYPLGYLHDGIADHEVVLITPEGGKKVTAGGYDDSGRAENEFMDVALSADGSAKCRIRRDLYTDAIEPYIDFNDRKPETKRKILTSKYNCLCNNASAESISDNFGTFFMNGEIPELNVTFSMDVPSYAKVSGGRIFVPLNQSGVKMAYGKAERINTINIDESGTAVDSVRIVIPEGFAVEHIPENVSVESAFGQFSSEAKPVDGGIMVVQSLSFRKGCYPKETYQEYRSFAKAVTKAYESKLVLVRGTTQQER